MTEGAWKPKDGFYDDSYSVEREFRAAAVEEARNRGWVVYEQVQDSFDPHPCDLALVRCRTVLHRRLRVNGTTLSDARWVAGMERNGHDVGIWTPDDWPAICKKLKI